MADSTFKATSRSCQGSVENCCSCKLKTVKCGEESGLVDCIMKPEDMEDTNAKDEKAKKKDKKPKEEGKDTNETKEGKKDEKE